MSIFKTYCDSVNHVMGEIWCSLGPPCTPHSSLEGSDSPRVPHAPPQPSLEGSDCPWVPHAPPQPSLEGSDSPWILYAPPHRSLEGSDSPWIPYASPQLSLEGSDSFRVPQAPPHPHQLGCDAPWVPHTLSHPSLERSDPPGSPMHPHSPAWRGLTLPASPMHPHIPAWWGLTLPGCPLHPHIPAWRDLTLPGCPLHPHSPVWRGLTLPGSPMHPTSQPGIWANTTTFRVAGVKASVQCTHPLLPRERPRTQSDPLWRVLFPVGSRFLLGHLPPLLFVPHLWPQPVFTLQREGRQITSSWTFSISSSLGRGWWVRADCRVALSSFYFMPPPLPIDTETSLFFGVVCDNEGFIY